MPPTPLRLGTLDLGPAPRVVLAVGRRTPDLESARARGVSVLEARLDLFERGGAAFAREELARLRGLGLPLLLTCRLKSEGGRWEGDEDARKELLLACLELADGMDVEMDAAPAPELAKAVKRAGKTLLASHHWLAGTPPDGELERRFAQGKVLGADAVKLAAQASKPEDVLRMLAWTQRHRDEGVVGISMGPLGAVSRVAAPRFGSLLTYVGQDLNYGQVPLEPLTAALKALYPEFRAEHGE